MVNRITFRMAPTPFHSFSPKKGYLIDLLDTLLTYGIKKWWRHTENFSIVMHKVTMWFSCTKNFFKLKPLTKQNKFIVIHNLIIILNTKLITLFLTKVVKIAKHQVVPHPPPKKKALQILTTDLQLDKLVGLQPQMF